MRDLRKRGCVLLFCNQELKYQGLCPGTSERSRVEARAIFHIFFKGKVRDKSHLIFEKKVSTRHIRKTVAFRQRRLSDGYPEDGLQQVTRLRATCKEGD